MKKILLVFGTRPEAINFNVTSLCMEWGKGTGDELSLSPDPYSLTPILKESSINLWVNLKFFANTYALSQVFGIIHPVGRVALIPTYIGTR